MSVFASFLGYYDFKEWAAVWIGPLLFVVLIVLLVVMTRQMRPTKPQEIKPDKAPQIAWGEIAGVDEAKDELREVVEFMKDPKRFKALGANVPRGILLHGPPGTGKTLLAKAVAHESGAKFFAQSAAAFVETFVGVGSARIRRLFKVARKHAPAIVFIDELDAIGRRRGVGDVSGEKDQTLNQLLVELDGFEDGGQVVIVGASNRLEDLDPALLRPGRFDRQILVS
ncbi:MAG TPA: AAA family ATPase, partial [Conexibacter sp.]